MFTPPTPYQVGITKFSRPRLLPVAWAYHAQATLIYGSWLTLLVTATALTLP